MTRPEIPTRVEREGPPSPCTIHGVDLKWKNCTCISCAAGMNKSTHGRVNMTGCAVRGETNDVAGGTNLGQMQRVAAAHGVATDLHTGSRVATLWYASYQGSLGRGFQLDGNEIVTKGKNVNHDVWVNNPVGGTPGDPDGFIVYDPDSDGPSYWPYAKLKAFAMALHPYGEADPRTLKNMGINGVYCLIYPDTEPHVHLHYGGVKTSPFPDKLKIHSPTAGRRVNVRSRPDRIAAGDVKGTIASGTDWTAWQRTTRGVKLAGSSLWYGNHSGNRWIHSSGVVGAGGAS